MRVGLTTAVLVIVALLAGCTDIDSPEAAREEASGSAGGGASELSESAEESPSEQPSASETADATASESPDASESPLPSEPPDDDKADSEDDGTDTTKRKKPRLAAAKEGDQGAEVESLQQRLDKLGFAPGAIDGAYGPRTADAVKAFQMLAGLKQTGRADAKTIAALEEFQTDAPVLKAGDKGSAVKRLQRRLAQGPFDPGSADGEYGGKTVEAVWALEKLAGVPVDGNWGPLDEHAWEQLQRGAIGSPAKKNKKRWVEVDLSEQLMKVYDPKSSEPVLVSHVSTGSGVPWSNGAHSGNSITPTGDFVISRRISGWRVSSLDIGRLYNPLYFNGGIALHGAPSVPLYPASHGCVRVPMHIAEYLPGELPNGTPVHVLS